MTAFLPTAHVRRATEEMVASALPGAPVRAPDTGRDRRCRATIGKLLIALGRRLHPPRVPPAAAASGPVPDALRWEDPYTSWRVAAMLSADALRAWLGTEPADRPAAHAVYRAALDREEAAAGGLARSVFARRPGPRRA